MKLYIKHNNLKKFDLKILGIDESQENNKIKVLK